MNDDQATASFELALPLLTLLLAGTVALPVAPAPQATPSPPPPPGPVQVASAFADHWPELPLVPSEPVVRVVKTERIRALPKEEPPIVVAMATPAPDSVLEDDPPLTRRIRLVRKPVFRRKVARDDICRGKGRYFINGGRSWRCRR